MENWLRSLIVFVIFLLTYHTSHGSYPFVRDNLNVPCSFFDSLNITDGEKLKDGSYRHRGIVYPQHLVGTYDYEFENITHRKPATPHLRGCICKIKTCLRSCCEDKTHIYTIRNKSCDPYEGYIDSNIWVKNEDGSLAEIDVFQNYGWVWGRPCEVSFLLEPTRYEYDQWQLLHNGTLVLTDNMEFKSKNEYCMTPLRAWNSTVVNISIMSCFTENDTPTREIIYSYSMLFSVPFMIITVFIYTIIPELRNLHGKSLSCYLSGLAVGYSILSYYLIAGAHELSQQMCSILGFAAYFCFMSSFLWLSVISFDLWWNFRGTKGINRLNENKRFLIYCLYSWGLSAIFLTITAVMQHVDIPKDYQPGIGGGDYCWLDMRKWIQIVYFFGPIILVIVFNITMFTLTSLKIHRVQREMARIMARQDSQRNLHGEKDRFGLFLRLFIVMGVTWSLEIIAWLCESQQLSKFFYLTDICNAVQGFIIFALFVLKKKVKVLILKRYRVFRNIPDRTSQCSRNTNSSNITMTSVNTTPAEKPLVSENLKGRI